MIKKRHILILSIILSNILFSQKQESIIDKIEIAESYYEAGLIEDAISIYNNILDVQKTILGPSPLGAELSAGALHFAPSGGP